MRKFVFILFIVIFSSVHAVELDSLKFKPKIEGTIRAKCEYNTNLNAYRFQVRNARFSVNGNFSSIVYYKAEIDLSDEGVTKMLDAYLRFLPSKAWNITLGQQKIPFSTDNLRAPYQLYFANRSFIGKQITGLRDVGITLLYLNKTKIPLSMQIGIYNGDGIYNQQEWQNKFCIASRFEIFPIKNFEISLNYNSIVPENYRMHFFDLGSYVNFNGWHFETEYVYKIYQNNFFRTTRAFYIFGAYDIPIRKPFLKKITPLIRFDRMTDNNNGYIFDNNTPDDKSDDYYNVTDVARKRITSGLTFSLNKPFLNDIRLNYEKYFYGQGIVDKDDKLVIEAVVRF